MKTMNIMMMVTTITVISTMTTQHDGWSYVLRNVPWSRYQPHTGTKIIIIIIIFVVLFAFVKMKKDKINLSLFSHLSSF